MLELIKSGGWVMGPLLLSSVIALAIIAERFWSLRKSRVCPDNLISSIRKWVRDGELDDMRVRSLAATSLQGRLLAAGLANRRHGRDIMKESIEDVGRQIILELERYLNALGTIASATPLLGLLGTVIGMIKVFAIVSSQGVGDAAQLAGGISEALVTTATGMTIAIPTLAFYRYFRGKVERLVAYMEEEAQEMLEIMSGDREFNANEEEGLEI